MKKSVYSLVLTDDIVAQVDRVAYAAGTSRSNMINQILAEYVSYVTPEKRMREIFSAAENLLRDLSGTQLMLQPSDSMLSLRSALHYKYNPTVRYSVELFRDSGGAAGQLRISLRSQNETLILLLRRFFLLWQQVEQNAVGPVQCTIEDGRYTRLLQPTAPLGSQALGQLIAAYIQTLDSAMKAYFTLLEQPAQAARKIEALYAHYIKEHPVIL